MKKSNSILNLDFNINRIVSGIISLVCINVILKMVLFIKIAFYFFSCNKYFKIKMILKVNVIAKYYTVFNFYVLFLPTYKIECPDYHEFYIGQTKKKF